MRGWKIRPIVRTRACFCKDLINELKNILRLKIKYDDKAALAQAQKIDALRQMDVHLNATRRLVGYVANGITRGTGPKHIYDTDLAVDYSAQAAEDASKAAKLAKFGFG